MTRIFAEDYIRIRGVVGYKHLWLMIDKQDDSQLLAGSSGDATDFQLAKSNGGSHGDSLRDGDGVFIKHRTASGTWNYLSVDSEDKVHVTKDADAKSEFIVHENPGRKGAVLTYGETIAIRQAIPKGDLYLLIDPVGGGNTGQVRVQIAEPTEVQTLIVEQGSAPEG